MRYTRWLEDSSQPVKVTLERLPESRVLLDIEVDADRLERSLNAAYKRIAQRSRIPGFRPGKAPRAIVEQRLGRQGLIREALDTLVPDVYNEAIETEDVDAIAQPELEIVEIEPVRFKATVPVRPTVALNDYRSIHVEKDPVEVTDEMVAEQVLALRRRHATQVPVERPVQWADILIADVSGSVDDESFINDDDAEFTLREGEVLLLPGLAEAFLGMERGAEKVVELDIPADFRAERLQGKTATFTLKLKEIKEEQLPDEDDEFANMVDAEQFETIDALRQRIRDDLQQSLEEQAETRFRNQAVDALVEHASLDYPRVMVDREIEHLVDESTGKERQAYFAYLQRIGRSEQDFRETFREAADERVKRSLVISQLAEDEGILVSDADIDAEIDRLAGPLGDDAEAFRQIFAGEEGRASIRRQLLSQRTLDRLAAIAAGDPPGPTAAPAAEAPAAAEPAEEEQPA